MQADFSIEVDPASSLVRITLRGMFTPSDIARFVAARNEAHRKLRCVSHQHVTLVDIRDMSIQTQDGVADFKKVLNNPRMISRRLAFVVAKSLSRLQVQRAAREREARYFTTLKEAKIWLLDDTAMAACASLSSAASPPSIGVIALT